MRRLEGLIGIGEADVQKDELGNLRRSDFPRDTGEGFVMSRFVQWHAIYSREAES